MDRRPSVAARRSSAIGGQWTGKTSPATLPGAGGDFHYPDSSGFRSWPPCQGPAPRFGSQKEGKVHSPNGRRSQQEQEKLIGRGSRKPFALSVFCTRTDLHPRCPSHFVGLGRGANLQPFQRTRSRVHSPLTTHAAKRKLFRDRQSPSRWTPGPDPLRITHAPEDCQEQCIYCRIFSSS
jgi:hypothetical protein